MKTMSRAVTLLAALVPAAVLAQGPGERRNPHFGPPGPPPPGFAGPGLGLDEGPDGSPVKGAPFKAQVVDEHTQTLSDGNRIVQKTTAATWRDGEGRTRREMDGRVMIDDPVAGAGYMLEPEAKTAFERPSFRGPHGPQGPGRAGGPRETAEAPTTAALGTRTIEGFEATGTRTTTTIPAGAIGNEKPIQIVSERWYAPELQAVVLGTHRDPRFGLGTHRLTGITRGEPDKSLFEVPSDYTVRQGPPPFGGPRPGRPQERP